MGRNATPRRAVVLAIAAVALAAVAVWLHVPAPGATLPASAQHLPSPVLLAAFLGAELLAVRFWFRGDTHNFSLSGVPLLLGLVFSTPVATVATRLVGTAIAVTRRRMPFDKVAFNLCLVALETGVAAIAHRAVLGDGSPVSPVGWLAGGVAVLAADATSHVGVVGIIRVSGGPLARAALGTMLEVGAALVVTTVSFALVAVLVLSVDARGGVLLVVVGVVATLAYRSYGALRGRYAGLEILYRFTDALAPVERPEDVVQTVLRQAAESLSARAAEVTLIDGDSFVVCRFDAGMTFATTSAPPPALAHVADGRCVRTDQGLAIVAPLRSGGDVIGTLGVEERLGEQATFDDDDLRVLAALANHASVALRNGRLLEEVREQASVNMYRALHDELTGLGNRAHLVAEVNRLLEAAIGDGIVAVMLMDLDGFKEINDTLGHHAGDAVLQQVASNLASIEDRAVVARLGGDEFAVAIGGLADCDAARDAAREIIGLIEQPVVADVALDVRVSVGVAIAPLDGTDLSELLRRGDIAMYQAKSSKSGVELYDHGRDPHSARRLALAAELRTAIDDGGLELRYQPKVNLASGAVLGFEALARWDHEEHGFVPPDEFIPVAETAGLMRPLTVWVLDRALADLRSWLDAGFTCGVSVNVSARTLADPRLCDDVRDALDRYRIDPCRLTLEITESTLMTQLDRSLAALERLAAAGVHLSVDDFGIGYSSLAQLKGLPVHEVKIDKSFVFGMTQSTTDAAIVEVVVQLAAKLGLDVVAEGIEDIETFNRLRALGCLAGQGYHMAKPMPATSVPDWVTAWHRPVLDALIVDDHPAFRSAMRVALEIDGVAVLAEAGDGEAAVEQAARFQPQLIVLDLAMPRVTGLAALPRIRAVAPNATVVVVSGTDDPDAGRSCLRAGAAAYLDKVIGPDRLAQAAVSCVRHRPPAATTAVG